MAKRIKNFQNKIHSNLGKIINQITRLENGLTVVTEKIPFFNSFALGIGVKVGSRNDFKGKEGLAHLLEHCVFRRTKNYDSSEINELFEKYGAYANAFTTKENTLFYVRGLNYNFQKIWDLLSEIVFQPRFLLKDIRKEKSIVCEEIRSYNEDPEEAIFDYTDKIIFSKSTLRHPIVGTISSIKKIDLDDIVNFYETNYLFENIVISVIGNFEHSYILDLISMNINQNNIKSLKKFQGNQIQIKSQRIIKTLYKKFLQSHIIYSKVLPFFEGKDRILLAIASLLTGESSSSRLFKTLREKYGLVYNIFSTFFTYSDCSPIYIYCTMEQRKRERTINVLSKELMKIYQNGFTNNELIIAKEQLKSATYFSMENLSERLQSLVRYYLTFGKYENLFETIELINSIKLNDINEFVFKYFNPDSWSIISYIPKD